MKLPLAWLKEYVDVSVSGERLAGLLTMSGSKVERVERRDGGDVLEIEVTTNRPDCLSVLGLAREVSALTKRKIREPRLSIQNAARSRRIPIRIEDKKGCPYYTGRAIEGVRVHTSPEKIQKALGLMGTRAIHNVVDATNYVLFEIGQPLHAFDLDKLHGGITVRRARAGERLVGIDGVEYVLDPETLVIADDTGPVAIAGVIGGKATEVTESTKNILLESAYFEPAAVRRASRAHKISTESSYRFERRVDAARVDWASRRAADLILEWSGGTLTGAFAAGAAPRAKNRAIRLRLSRLDAVLGTGVAPRRALSILSSLGFRTKLSSNGVIFASAPSFRHDVIEEADLIEEVLRIEGFDRIEETLPPTRYSEFHLKDRRESNLKKESLPELKRHLASQGFQEIITYSLLSEKALSDLSFDLSRCAQNKIVNPASAEQAYLRPSLLPGMLGAVVHNVHRKAFDLKLFEIGKCYRPGRKDARGGEKPEFTAAALLLYGMAERNWRRKVPAAFSDLKGAVESLLQFLGRRSSSSIEAAPAESSCTRYVNRATVKTGGQMAGFLAGVHPSVLKKWDIPHEVLFAELDVDRVVEEAPRAEPVRAGSIPKFPAVFRDIAFVIDRKIPSEEIERVLREAGQPHLKRALPFDEYIGKEIPEGKRSLAFSLELSKDTGTFTDEEIAAVQKRIGEALKNRFAVEFR